MYDIQLLKDVLAKEEEFTTQGTFCGNTSVDNQGATMEERKARARSAGLSGFLDSLQKRPTSTSRIICKEKEGRATRELELIWWPNLLKKSHFGKFQLRLFIEKTSL